MDFEVKRFRFLISRNRFSRMNVLLYRQMKEVIPPNTEKEVVMNSTQYPNII